MDANSYTGHVSGLDALCKDIINAKREVYTKGSPDILYNFKIAAELQGTTPGQVLATYLIKQILSIIGLLTQPKLVDTEQATRFADARNYIDLAYVMFKEGSTHITRGDNHE